MATTITLIGNFIIATIVLALVFYGKITWAEGMAFIGTLLFPSAGSVIAARRQQTALSRLNEAVKKSIPPTTMFTFCLSLLFFAAACPQTANGPTTDADSSVAPPTTAASPLCIALQGLTGSNTVETICATVDEIAQVVAYILTLRQGDAGTAWTCTVIPTTNLCATGREIGQGIEFLIRKRQARLMLDGGT